MPIKEGINREKYQLSIFYSFVIMNIIRVLSDTLFYSKSHLSIVFQNKDVDTAFVIKYKHSICGSLDIKDKKIALIYGRGLHFFKGLIDCHNIEIKYNNKILELYTKTSNRSVLKAKCENDVFETIQSKINI